MLILISRPFTSRFAISRGFTLCAMLHALCSLLFSLPQGTEGRSSNAVVSTGGAHAPEKLKGGSSELSRPDT
jgi:hypothetical protein